MVSVKILIKKSRFKGAGNGAFAGSFIEKNTEFGQYRGEVLTPDEYQALENTDYVFEVTHKDGQKRYVDAQDPSKSNWLRYINGARTSYQRTKINVEYYQKNRKIYCRAIQNIPIGTELIADYGGFYWSN